MVRQNTHLLLYTSVDINIHKFMHSTHRAMYIDIKHGIRDFFL